MNGDSSDLRVPARTDIDPALARRCVNRVLARLDRDVETAASTHELLQILGLDRTAQGMQADHRRRAS